MTHVFQGQLLTVDNRVPGHVGDRHLRGGNKVQVLFLDMELVFGELGQLAGAEQAVGVDQVGNVDLHVFVFTSMYVQHELDQGPVQPGDCSRHHYETGAGDAGGGLKIDQPQGLTQSCMVLGNKILHFQLSPGPYHLIIVLAVSGRDTLMGHIGHAAQELVQFLLDLLQPGLAGFQFVAQGGDLRPQRFDVLSRGLGFANRLRLTVPLRLQFLGVNLGLFTLPLQRLEPVDIQFKAALGQALAHGIHIFT